MSCSICFLSLQGALTEQQTIRVKNKELKDRIELVVEERDVLQQKLDRSEEQRMKLEERVLELERKMIQIEKDAERHREQDAEKLAEATRRVLELERERDDNVLVTEVDPSFVAAQNDSGIDLGPDQIYRDLLAEAVELNFDPSIFDLV